MDTPHHDLIVGAVSVATAEVFSTMLGLEVHHGDAFLESASPGPSDGVVSLIGLAGAWVGTGSVACSAAFACRAASLMLMTESPGVDGDVLDAVAELTNMIVGNVKTVLEGHFGPMGLSIPTVVFGRNFSARSVGNGPWMVVPFTCEDAQFDVKICLAPNRQAGRPAGTNTHSLQG
jgi:chemotaxis protein CheX